MSPQKPQPAGEAICFEISPEVADGAYINIAHIIHSETEFILDFGWVVPGRTEVKIRSRIITSPKHAKQLLLALQENVAKYEHRYGTIDVSTLASQPMEDKSKTIN